MNPFNMSFLPMLNIPDWPQLLLLISLYEVNMLGRLEIWKLIEYHSFDLRGLCPSKLTWPNYFFCTVEGTSILSIASGLWRNHLHLNVLNFTFFACQTFVVKCCIVYSKGEPFLEFFFFLFQSSGMSPSPFFLLDLFSMEWFSLCSNPGTLGWAGKATTAGQSDSRGLW